MQVVLLQEERDPCINMLCYYKSVGDWSVATLDLHRVATKAWWFGVLLRCIWTCVVLLQECGSLECCCTTLDLCSLVENGHFTIGPCN